MDNKDRLYTEQEAKDQLVKWKDIYQAIFMIDILDIQFVWRELSRAEFKKAMEYFEDEYERAEYICKLCVLDPIIDYTDAIRAGIPETLAQHILQESGFTNDDSKIKRLMYEYENEVQRFDNQISCVIAEVFSTIPIEEIEHWSMEKTLWYFSRAKWILKTLRGVELTEEKPDTLKPPM